jgi:hypothetical protein
MTMTRAQGPSDPRHAHLTREDESASVSAANATPT